MIKYSFDVKKFFLKIYIDHDISKLVDNNKKTLFEIFAKTYNFFFKNDDFVNVAKIEKNFVNDHEISFSLHENFVSKNQFDFFNQFATIVIFFDITRVFVDCIQKNLESKMNNEIVVEKRDRNVWKNHRENDDRLVLQFDCSQFDHDNVLNKIFFCFFKIVVKKNWSNSNLFFMIVSTIVFAIFNWFALNLFQSFVTNCESTINANFSRINRLISIANALKSIIESNKS